MAEAEVNLVQTDTGTDSVDKESGDHAVMKDLPRSIKKKGRFIIPWEFGGLPSIKGLFKYIFTSKNNSKIPSKEELDKHLPIQTPDHELLATPPSTGVRVTWIGHATVLVQMNNISILTDPIFSARCSPVPLIGLKRYRDVPCTVKDLPKIDAVVISHNHYDHLDLNTVKELNHRFGRGLQWFVPLGLHSWMKSTGCDHGDNVMELDWWQEGCIRQHPDISFAFTPAQHWSKRTATDDNKVLWGSWCISGPGSKFFFAGDTGYCDVFKLIGQKYGPFDCSAIPIGAYEPRWFMKPQHVDPAEAVQIHQDVRSKKSLAIHWGTFNLSNEFYLEPPEKLKESLKQNGLSLSEFFTLNHGKSVHLEDTETETSLGVEVKEDTETETSLGVEVKEDAADKSKI